MPNAAEVAETPFSIFSFTIRNADSILPADCAHRGSDRAYNTAQTLVTRILEDKNERFNSKEDVRKCHARLDAGTFRVQPDDHAEFCPEFDR